MDTEMEATNDDAQVPVNASSGAPMDLDEDADDYRRRRRYDLLMRVIARRSRHA